VSVPLWAGITKLVAFGSREGIKCIFGINPLIVKAKSILSYK